MNCSLMTRLGGGRSRQLTSTDVFPPCPLGSSPDILGIDMMLRTSRRPSPPVLGHVYNECAEKVEGQDPRPSQHPVLPRCPSSRRSSHCSPSSPPWPTPSLQSTDSAVVSAGVRLISMCGCEMCLTKSFLQRELPPVSLALSAPSRTTTTRSACMSFSFFINFAGSHETPCCSPGAGAPGTTVAPTTAPTAPATSAPGGSPTTGSAPSAPSSTPAAGNPFTGFQVRCF